MSKFQVLSECTKATRLFRSSTCSFKVSVACLSLASSGCKETWHRLSSGQWKQNFPKRAKRKTEQLIVHTVKYLSFFSEKVKQIWIIWLFRSMETKLFSKPKEKLKSQKKNWKVNSPYFKIFMWFLVQCSVSVSLCIPPVMDKIYILA